MAFAAALLGSLSGAALYVIVETPSEQPLMALLGLTSLIALFGFLVSFVALLAVGIPLSWPFREIIYRHPLQSAALYGCLGSLLGLWITLLVGLAGQVTLIPALSIGGGTAVAWIWMMCRNRPGTV